VTLVAPPTLLPPTLEGWPVEVSHDLDEALVGADVVYLLRMQRERMGSAMVPNLHEYTSRFGLTRERARRLREHVLVMHPGPMNRGVEVVADPAELAGSLIVRQVTNGVAVRMAVLFDLLGTDGMEGSGE
jgi:aspartate carbamoyltransferase catalytic subunit